MDSVIVSSKKQWSTAVKQVNCCEGREEEEQHHDEATSMCGNNARHTKRVTVCIQLFHPKSNHLVLYVALVWFCKKKKKRIIKILYLTVTNLCPITYTQQTSTRMKRSGDTHFKVTDFMKHIIRLRNKWLLTALTSFFSSSSFIYISFASQERKEWRIDSARF